MAKQITKAELLATCEWQSKTIKAAEDSWRKLNTTLTQALADNGELKKDLDNERRRAREHALSISFYRGQVDVFERITRWPNNPQRLDTCSPEVEDFVKSARR